MAEQVTLKCKNGEDVTVSAEVATRSKVLNDAIEGGDDDCEVPVQHDSKTVKKAVEFLSHLGEEPAPTFPRPLNTAEFDQLCSGWYFDWIMAVDKDMRFELFMMANELNIEALSDLVGAKIACDMKVMSAEEQRAYLIIKNDFTEEEQARVKAEIETAAQYMS